ncbi:MAG: anti-sigma factor [Gemmataceae bacterium]
MNCRDVRQHWSLYHDSEADVETSFRISEHLSMCPECTEWFARQSRLEHAIEGQLGQAKASPGLWSRVLQESGLNEPPRTRRRWLAAALVSCLLVGLGGVAWHWFAPAAQADLVDLSSDWHERLVDGRQAVDYRSTSDLDVEHYLRERVSFPVRCPPRKDAGFSVQGAGVCRLATYDVAYLQGNVEDAPVSIFILARDSLGDLFVDSQEMQSFQRGRHEAVVGVVDRNVVMVVGRGEQAKLARVLKAYGTYPDHH